MSGMKGVMVPMVESVDQASAQLLMPAIIRTSWADVVPLLDLPMMIICRAHHRPRSPAQMPKFS